MQPDLLSPEKEENQPESSSPQEPAMSLSATPQEAPMETPPVEETAMVNPPSAEKKRSKFNFAYLALGVLVFLLLAVFAWVGYWAYDLNNQLTSTQQQLAGLQGDHAKLQTDYDTLNTTLKSENEKLNTGLAQAKADLEKANADLTAAQSDLSKTQDQTKSLKAKVDKAAKLTEILVAFSTVQSDSDFLELDRLIRESKNQDLVAKWNTIASEEDFRNFLDYLMVAARDSLK